MSKIDLYRLRYTGVLHSTVKKESEEMRMSSQSKMNKTLFSSPYLTPSVFI